MALLALAACASAAPARRDRAQSSSARVEAFAGYSHTKAGEAGLDGLGLSVSYRLSGPYSLVGELTQQWGTFAAVSLGETAFMGGVRRTWRERSWSPFAEVLLGAVRTSTSITVVGTKYSAADTDWGVALGAGLDYRLSPSWSGRGLFQLRLLRGEGATDTDPRFSIGAVYRFGR